MVTEFLSMLVLAMHCIQFSLFIISQLVEAFQIFESRKESGKMAYLIIKKTPSLRQLINPYGGLFAGYFAKCHPSKGDVLESQI